MKRMGKRLDLILCTAHSSAERPRVFVTNTGGSPGGVSGPSSQWNDDRVGHGRIDFLQTADDGSGVDAVGAVHLQQQVASSTGGRFEAPGGVSITIACDGFSPNEAHALI
jgi:hypothetical protein